MTHFTGVNELDGTAISGWNRTGFFAGTGETNGPDNSDALQTLNALRRHQKQAVKAAERDSKDLRGDSFLGAVRLNIQTWFEARRVATTLKEERRKRAISRVEPASAVAPSIGPFGQRRFEQEQEATERSAVAEQPASGAPPEAPIEIPVLPSLARVQLPADALLQKPSEAVAQRVERLFGRVTQEEVACAAPAIQQVADPHSLDSTSPMPQFLPVEAVSESQLAPLDLAPAAFEMTPDLQDQAGPITIPLDIAVEAPEERAEPVSLLLTQPAQRTAEPELLSGMTLELHRNDAVIPRDVIEINQPVTSVVETDIISTIDDASATVAAAEHVRDWIRPEVATTAAAASEFAKPAPLAYRAAAAQPALVKSAVASSNGFSLSNAVHAVANTAMRFVRGPSSKRAGARTTPRNGDPSFLGLQKRSDVIGAVNPIDTLYGFIRSMLHERQTGLVLHVVSATHGEGTTTIARALAERATTVGHRRALLIGMNTASGGAEAPEGLLSCIARGESVEGAIYETPGTSLATASLLGPTEQRTTDTKAVREAYKACRDLYELCIVDCPPIADGTYFDLVPEDADGIIFIVQAEKLRPAVIQRVKDMLEQQGGKILGIVLNQTKHYIPKVIYKLL